jgi:hypothetical protein
MTWAEHYAEQETGELHEELDWIHSCFDDYRELEQGISTKEVVRELAVIEELAKRGITRQRWN